MIKTESGEMIEPRVGDVVRVIPEDSVFISATGVIDKIYEAGNRGIRLEDGDRHYESECTLLHRPIQHGDLFEFYGEDGWEKGCNPYGRHYESMPRIRHFLPAWRDHSKWGQDK